MAPWEDAFINKKGFSAFSVHMSMGRCREGEIATQGGGQHLFGSARLTWGTGTVQGGPKE